MVAASYLPGTDKWPGRESDHSPPCTVGVEHGWSYYLHRRPCLLAMQRDNFSFRGYILPDIHTALPDTTL
jgi:hypothetical protein